MTINIPGQDPLLVVVDDDSYHYAEIMGDDTVTLKYQLPVHVELPVGSSIEWNGTTYTLETPANFKKQHSRYFDYTVTFSAPYAKLKIWKFRNTVDRRLKFSLTATPREHLEMLVDNLNERDGAGTWTMGDCISAEEHCISYDHVFCMEALQQMADEFETEYEVKNHTIALRKAEGEHIEQPDLTELKAQREELSRGLMQLQARLTKAEKDNDSLTKNRQRIAELEQQLARQNEQLAAIEMTEFRMQEFSKAKTRMLEDKVNGLFSLVRYKLFDRQINGAEVECCIPMVNGVPYPDVNTAGKINAGLDIINAISRSRGWSAPIFIDGAESVNTLMPTESQKVLLSVTTEPELHVTPFPASEAEMFD